MTQMDWLELPVISIVDDDPSFREATAELIDSFGYRSATFGTAEEFLQSERLNDSCCLITDVQMPGLSGVELQSELIAAGNMMPVIFISALSEEEIRGRALGAGAIGFLPKPFDEQQLIEYLEAALQRSSSLRTH